MIDPTTQMWREYYAQAARKAQDEILNRYGVFCPECQSRVLLPWDDYLCHKCRKLTSQPTAGIMQ